jgi:stearoyl-CoA desaturase (Delta-9 desaturase)
VGLASHLRRFSANEIAKGALTMRLKALKRDQNALTWPPAEEALPVISWTACERAHDEFSHETYGITVQEQAKDKILLLIAGFVHDATGFAQDHPGGEALVRSASGKDATASFFGGIYDHSNAAHNVSGPSGIRDSS